MRKLDVRRNTINAIQHVGLPLRSWNLINDNGSPSLSKAWVLFPKTGTIRSHKSRARIPSNLNPASKEMISDSVELCETEVCFLHIQLTGTKARLPKTHNVPLDVDFESSRSPAKSESWNNPSLHFLQHYPHGNIVCLHMCDEYMKSIDSSVCHKLWFISWLIVQICSRTIEYQDFQFVPNINILEQFENILVTILLQISLLLLWSGGHRCME